MKINSGNLISPEIVLDMLKHVPKKDLRGLKEIRIMLRPNRKERRRYGLGDYHYSERKARVFLWSIKQTVVKYMHHDNNYYHVFLREIALTLFHEIGHHVHYQQGSGKELSDRHDFLKNKVDSPNVSIKNRSKYQEEMWSIHSNMEKFADNYMEKYIKKYVPIIPKFSEIPFIKMFREQYVDSVMDNLRKRPTFTYHDMAVIEHLRKCKISKFALYSVTEICNKINHLHHSYNQIIPKFRNKVRGVCIILENPSWYVSKNNRKFPYFTKEQVERLANNRYLIGLMEEQNKYSKKYEEIKELQYRLQWAKRELAEIMS